METKYIRYKAKLKNLSKDDKKFCYNFKQSHVDIADSWYGHETELVKHVVSAYKAYVEKQNRKLIKWVPSPQHIDCRCTSIIKEKSLEKETRRLMNETGLSKQGIKNYLYEKALRGRSFKLSEKTDEKGTFWEIESHEPDGTELVFGRFPKCLMHVVLELLVFTDKGRPRLDRFQDRDFLRFKNEFVMTTKELFAKWREYYKNNYR
jgi:hypothetical protein